MGFEVPTYDQLRDRYLQAIVNQQPDAAIGPDSDHYVRASAQAAVLEGVYAHQAWVFRQAFPDLADGDIMEKMANLKGLTRKAASAAGGTVRFSGAAGTVVPLGQQVFTAQGVYFATTVASAIGGGGTIDVTAAALVAGGAGNQANNTPATVSAPPAGITGAATILTMTSGADVESDADLLDRLLLELSETPQSGNKTDYERWARSVAGVNRAYVFDARRGAGTVDVVPMPAAGLPSAPLLAAVQAVLEVKRPVGMLPNMAALALAPTAVVQAVTAALAIAGGYTLAGVTPAVQAAIAAVFAELAPGNTLVRNALIRAILNVPGVTDVTLTAPAANVTSSVDGTHLEMVTQGVTNIT
jgi:uncharacterized phage protein gp47/JayE